MKTMAIARLAIVILDRIPCLFIVLLFASGLKSSFSSFKNNSNILVAHSINRFINHSSRVSLHCFDERLILLENPKEKSYDIIETLF